MHWHFGGETAASSPSSHPQAVDDGPEVRRLCAAICTGFSGLHPHAQALLKRRSVHRKVTIPVDNLVDCEEKLASCAGFRRITFAGPFDARAGNTGSAFGLLRESMHCLSRIAAKNGTSEGVNGNTNDPSSNHDISDRPIGLSGE